MAGDEKTGRYPLIRRPKISLWDTTVILAESRFSQ